MRIRNRSNLSHFSYFSLSHAIENRLRGKRRLLECLFVGTFIGIREFLQSRVGKKKKGKKKSDTKMAPATAQKLLLPRSKHALTNRRTTTTRLKSIICANANACDADDDEEEENMDTKNHSVGSDERNRDYGKPARRIIVSALSTASIAIGANFLGVTTALLSRNEDLSRALRLDLLYSTNGFRREYNASKGYEFVYPNEYLADQTIAKRNAIRKARSLDLPSLNSIGRVVGEPESAFGPMGGDGEENVSVIVQNAGRGKTSSFSLERFGSADEQATWLLDNVLAKEGSGKEGKLIAAEEREIDGVVYYEFEYTIRSANWFRRNIAVFAQNKKTGDIYSYVAQAPMDRWDAIGEKFKKSSQSFRVFQPKPPSF